MTIDPARLLAFDIPSTRQRVTAADAALYALSVGLGQDPMDERQLAFVDRDLGPRVMPSMALVLAHPGFWLAHPDSGVDPASVLHADQSFEILAPLPAEGEVVSRTHITGLSDKGPGKAALLQTETMIEDGDGRALARLVRTTFLRNGGGFGGENRASPPAPPAPGDNPDHIVDLTVRPEQALLYRLNGDYNPLHASPASAKAAGFERPILHGLCTAGFMCHAVLRVLADYDERRLTSLRLRFAQPVVPGETLRVEIWNSGAFRARIVERDVLAIDAGFALIAPLIGD